MIVFFNDITLIELTLNILLVNLLLGLTINFRILCTNLWGVFLQANDKW